MIEMEEFSAIIETVKKEGFHLFYLSRPACGVCKALRVKVEELLEAYPKIDTYYVNLDKIPQAAGQFSVFTIPAILLYIDGHEVVREARYLSMDELDRKIGRPYRLAFN